MSDPQTVQVRTLRENLADVLRQVEEGAEFVVISRGRQVARISPAPKPARRQLGLMKGRIWMAPDFDETPADIIAAMEGESPP